MSYPAQVVDGLTGMSFQHVVLTAGVLLPMAALSIVAVALLLVARRRPTSVSRKNPEGWLLLGAILAVTPTCVTFYSPKLVSLPLLGFAAVVGGRLPPRLGSYRLCDGHSVGWGVHSQRNP